MIHRPRVAVCLFGLLFPFAIHPGAVPAQEESLKPGINERFENPEIEGAIKLFEAEKRDVVRKRDEIVAACRVEPGMTVADVGAGTGLFTRAFAGKVAPEGKVYAVDISEPFIEHVKKTCRESDIDNVVGVVCTPTSAKLPPESADLAFVCDTHHHFEYPFKMIESIRQALRPEGYLIIVDRKEASDHVRADQATVRKEVTGAGFKFIEEKDVSEREYLMRFQKTQLAACPPPGDSPGGDAAAHDGQQSARLDRQVRVTMDYLLFLPEGYDGKDAWPLMLFLHGAGERGDALELVKVHGPPKIVDTKKDFPFILVSPQCKSDRWWQPYELTALLDDVVEKLKVDEDRIYVTGLSMGGFGTWSLAGYTPHRFAAIAPICGGSEPFRAKRLAHLPTWVFHGAQDKVVPLRRSQEMVDALKKREGNVKLTIYPEAEHDSWTETYNNPELYEWLLKHRRHRGKGEEVTK